MPEARSDDLRILLIEDNPGDARLIAESLVGAGAGSWPLERVERLSAGLDRLSRPGIEAVLLDLSLPDCSGPETARRLCGRHPGVAVVVLTGLADDAAGLAAVQAGAQDYLVKGRSDGALLTHALRYAVERKRSAEALRQSQELLEKSQRVARLGSWTTDPSYEGHIQCSREALRIFGVLESDFDGRIESFFARVHPEDREGQREAALRALAGEAPYRIDYRIVLPDGTVSIVHAEAEVERSANGRPLRMLGTVQDVTEQRRLEAALVQAQKMEAVGQLAGGIAHDFNNVLGVIIGHRELLLRDLGPVHPGRSRLEQIGKAAERAATLTRQLLAFSRKQVLQPKVLDLGAVVAEVEEMLRSVLPENVQITSRLAPDLWPVLVDPRQLELAVLNLALNARDAMPQGGRLTLETFNVEPDDTYLSGRPDGRPGPHAVLAVSDTGHGMDPKVLPHVFEPFFTTKEPGKGTGLGLATVYGFVQQSGGFVHVYSEPGKGTTFRLHLPRTSGEAPEPPPPDDAPRSRGSETVLLVEDNAPLREMVRELLEDAGYVVLEAGEAEQALVQSASHRGPIDLLLTDVVQPKMSGRELADCIRAARPGTRVLYMSGYTSEAIGHHGVLDAGAPFLEKPFSGAGLLAKVREALQRPLGS